MKNSADSNEQYFAISKNAIVDSNYGCAYINRIVFRGKAAPSKADSARVYQLTTRR